MDKLIKDVLEDVFQGKLEVYTFTLNPSFAGLFVGIFGDMHLYFPSKVEEILMYLENSPLAEVFHNAIDTSRFTKEEYQEAFVYFIAYHEYGHYLDALSNSSDYIEEVRKEQIELQEFIDSFEFTDERILKDYEEVLSSAFNQLYRAMPAEQRADEHAVKMLQEKYSLVCV